MVNLNHISKNGFLLNLVLFPQTKDSCPIIDSVMNITSCTNLFNSETKETNNYGFGWSQYDKNYTPPNGFQYIYRAFQYRNEDELQGSPSASKYNTYGGDGFVYELRGKQSFLQGNLSLLQNMQWIDRQTRAVFIEFSAYNPNINMVMVSSISVEFLPSGSILTMASFEPLNLFGESIDSVLSFKTLCELIFMTFIVYFLICEIKEAIKLGFKQYMR